MQQQLPFVWRLRHPRTGAISHAVGTCHKLKNPFEYSRDALHLIAGKHAAFFERNGPFHENPDALDTIIHNLAQQFMIPTYGLELAEEKQRDKEHYRAFKHNLITSPYTVRQDFENKCNTHLDKIFTSEGHTVDLDACANSFSAFYEQLTSKEKLAERLDRNRRMAERSIPYLNRPSIIAIGLLHFGGNNNILEHYTHQGFQIKRV